MEDYKIVMRQSLSAYVEGYRKTKGLTQEQIAEKLHITPRAYSNLKQGKFCFSTPSLLFFIFLLDNDELFKFLAKLKVKMKEEFGEV